MDQDEVQLAAQALQELRTSSSSPPPYEQHASSANSGPANNLKNQSTNSATDRQSSFSSSTSHFRPIKPKQNAYAYGVYHRRTKSNTPLGPSSTHADHIEKKKKRRPVWQDVLVSATSLASISKESRMRLRYCLNLLKLANSRLANTVGRLQELIQREKAAAIAQNLLQQHQNSSSGDYPMASDSDSEDTVTFLKQDLISTIRKVVTVVSTFAGNSLPEPARSHVKHYILQLPLNWALALTPEEEEEASGKAKANNDGASSPSSESSSSSIHMSDGEGLGSSAAQAEIHAKQVEAGGRLLSLAQEALDMLGNIISIVGDTLDRAESWCQKVGLSATNDDDMHAAESTEGADGKDSSEGDSNSPPEYDESMTPSSSVLDNKIQI
uniref:ARAD1D28116p n=1 Tax=Blastobotrys adeninivorans TaxID=409370 RepID=A0A060TB25_BLAAD